MFNLQSQPSGGISGGFGYSGDNWSVNVGYTQPATYSQTAANLQLAQMQLQQKSQSSMVLVVALIAVAALFIFKS